MRLNIYTDICGNFMIRSTLSLVVILTFISSAFGKTFNGDYPLYIVRGTVQDSMFSTGIGQAIVSLVNSETGKIEDGTLTDSLGNFILNVKNEGEYLIKITAINYQPFKSTKVKLNDSFPVINLGIIPLVLIPQLLKEAVITGNKPLIENKIDKLVYNASQDISSKGGSATDLLRKVPMVEVDLDGNVSIRGSQNIRVLIDGKPSGIVSASIRDALRTIPADEIESVEVITNPSAKYDAEGTAGIINIVLKANKLKGTSGNIHTGGGNRSGHLGAGISTQKKKTGLSFRVGGFYWRNVGDGITDRKNTIDTVEYRLLQTSSNRVFGFGPRVSLGIDHTFNKRNSVSISATARGSGNDSKSSWVTETGSNYSPMSLLYGRNTGNFNLTVGYDVSVDHKKTFKKEGRELITSFLYNGNSINTTYNARQTNAQNVENYKEKSSNTGLNSEYSFQTDLTEPLSKKLKLESGLKGIIRTVNSNYSFDSFSYINNEYSVINGRSNSFTYYQNVYSLYSQLTYTINTKYSVRFGGRYEFTTYGGERKDSSVSFTGKPYQNLIPFLSINRAFGYTGYLRLNYTQRLLRPSLFYLNPYTNFSDPRNLTTGNPYLRAELAHNIELSAGKYTSKGGMSATLYHRRTNNAIESMRNVDAAGVYQTTYGNVGLNFTSGMDVNINLKGKNWMLNFNGGTGLVTIKSNQTTGLVAGVSNSGIVYNAGVWGFYKFTQNWSVETFTRVNAPTFSLQGRTQNWYFHTIGFKRRFKNDVGGIGVGLDNPFTPHVKYTTVQSGPDFYYLDKRDINMLGIRVNFDYRFGKVEVDKPNKNNKGIKNDDLKPGNNDSGGQGGS